MRRPSSGCGYSLYPEGGWFRENYRRGNSHDPARMLRAHDNLLACWRRHQLSRRHVVQSDEIWHFLRRRPLIVYDPATRDANLRCFEALERTRTCRGRREWHGRSKPEDTHRRLQRGAGIRVRGLSVRIGAGRPRRSLHRRAGSLREAALIGCKVAPGRELVLHVAQGNLVMFRVVADRSFLAEALRRDRADTHRQPSNECTHVC